MSSRAETPRENGGEWQGDHNQPQVDPVALQQSLGEKQKVTNTCDKTDECNKYW